jgi:transcriptional regulator with XRE-family HTH domain
MECLLTTDEGTTVATRTKLTKSRRVEVEGFGPRLARLRQSRGLTQEELGERVGLSNRMIAYYEREEAEPPGPQLPALAQALRVSTDELLGVKRLPEVLGPKTARLLKRLQQVEALPPADQRAVLKVVDALLATRGRAKAAS